MPSADDAAIRAAVFDLMLSRRIPTPSNQTFADRAGVPVEQVDAIFTGGPDPVFDYMLSPFIDAVDENLRGVPMTSAPTVGEQEEIIEHIVDAAAACRPQLIALLGLLLDRFESPGNPQIDHFAYQAAVRLLGASYDPDSPAVHRVRLMIEALSVAVISPWHDMENADHRRLIVRSLLGTINPPG